MFLTDKIARKAFCVGGLFYPIIFVPVKYNPIPVDISVPCFQSARLDR